MRESEREKERLTSTSASSARIAMIDWTMWIHQIRIWTVLMVETTISMYVDLASSSSLYNYIPIYVRERERDLFF